ncbi:MAG: translation initiation factor IF-2 [Oscillospiraceae bacterium]|nr:translation initiation factor IF-2 [Oscillospiraceae bacterium]MBQ5312673.1 translation initiation factor IF-2 [Oscillospiraceae bacterium]
MVIKYKASNLIEDFNLNAKTTLTELTELFGTEIKKGTVLTETQCNIAFEHYTKQAKTDDFANYLGKKAEKPAVKEEAKKAAPKTEKPAAKKPMQEKPKADRPAPKAENKPAEKQQPKADKKPVPKQEQPKQQPKNNEPLKRADGTIVEARQPKQKTEKQAPAVKQEFVTVTVDTRQTNVNLDKFNERYDELADTKNFGNNRKNANMGGKQKFNKNGKNQKQNPFAKKKQETEAERLERMHLEKARKAQLKVQIPDEITVGELASRLKVTASEVIKRLMMLGVMASISQVVDFDTASVVAEELGAKVEKEVVVTIEERLFEEVEDTAENTEKRPPVVVVMGHVDHGKTSLLDAIRKTNVTSGEAGGITQHIGAYQVVAGGETITFLDTPGHEAFTSMRQRGAMVTDIAILVVAADDGIMPQTIESINHAKAANIPIIVAINKIDKPTANPERVKQELTEHGLVPEEWGGDTICVPVSAKMGMGIDDLLEMINLTSEVNEYKANPNRRAKGAVIEARLDKGLGPVATILVQNGTLHKGDVLIAGTAVGRVRVMQNDKGERIEVAGPSTPVEITGLTEVPSAGDLFDAVEDEKLARELAEKRTQALKEEKFSSYQKVTLDNLFSQIAQGEMKELPIIVKADVQGSAEAVKQSLEKLSNDEVRVKVIHAAVGAVNKSDVMLASASNAIIIGFNVRPDATAKADAEHDQVEMRMYRVIYDALEDVKAAMKGMLAPKFREVELGHAEVRSVFKLSSAGTVAGCYVKEGKVARHAKIRVVRDGIVIAEDEILSLKRFKDDQREVAAGYECGIGLEKFNDIKEGDIFESFIMEEYRE